MDYYDVVKLLLVMAVMVIGIACIWVGVRLLYRPTVVQPVSNGTPESLVAVPAIDSDVKTPVVSISLKNSPPGVIIIAFGVVLVIFAFYDGMSFSPHSVSNQVARSISVPATANQPAAAIPPPVPAAKPVTVQPTAIIQSTPVIFREPTGGYYVKQGPDWLEYQHPGDTSPMANFSESYTDDQYVVLYDNSRDMYVRLPKNGGMADWSHTNPVVWTPMYYISTSNNVSTAPK